MQKRKRLISLPLIAICFALGFFIVPSIIGKNLLLLRMRTRRYLPVNMEEMEPLKNEKKEPETYLHSLADTKNSAELKDGATDAALSLEITEEKLPSDESAISKQVLTTTQESITMVNTGIGEELNIKIDNELCPEEFMLLNWYRNSNKLTTDLPPQYILENHGLDDFLDYVNTLLSNGFLRESNTVESLALLKVVELKESLKAYHLKVSGKKQELIERLVDNLAKEDLEKILIRKAYLLTEKGEQTLAEHQDLIDAYQKEKMKL